MLETKGQITNAAIKLTRALDSEDQVDPVSGFTTEEIISELRMADIAVSHLADAALRRHGINPIA